MRIDINKVGERVHLDVKAAIFRIFNVLAQENLILSPISDVNNNGEEQNTPLQPYISSANITRYYTQSNKNFTTVQPSIFRLSW